MIFFLYLLYSIAFVYVSSLFLGKRKKMFFLVASGVLLTLFLGFRNIYTGGIDLIRYNDTYDTLLHADSIISAYEFRQGENIFFYSSMFIFAKMGISFQFFLFILAALSVSSSLIFYYRYSDYPLLCICIFLPTCYIHLFSQLKQAIAVSIVTFAYMLFRNHKVLWTYVLLLVAILIHPTALVMVPFFILCKYRAKPLLLIILFVGSLFVYLLRMEIGHFLTVAFYSQHLYKYESRESITGMAVLFIIITISYLILMPKRRSVSKENFLLISTYLYALIIAMTIFFCASYSFAFTRLNNYYMMFVPLALSEMAEFKIWKGWSRLPLFAMYGVIMYVMIDMFLNMVVSEQLFMYNFFWMN